MRPLGEVHLTSEDAERAVLVEIMLYCLHGCIGSEDPSA